MLAGAGNATFAQVSKMAQPALGSSRDLPAFTDRTNEMTAALKGDNFAAAKKLSGPLYLLMIKRGDDLARSQSGGESENMYRLGRRLEELSKDVKKNKSALLQLMQDMKKVY